MADTLKIKERIQEIASRPAHVTLTDIQWVVDQLSGRHECSSRKVRHGKMFQVGNRTFQINPHNTGSRFVKTYSVKEFLSALADLGLYEE